MRKATEKYMIKFIAVSACLMITGLATAKDPVRDKDLKSDDKNYPVTRSIKEAKSMPVYGNWKNFTIKDGLPSDHTYAVRMIGDSVLVGTHDGLCVYSKGKWHTYTTKDGLAHNGVVSIDFSELTGDIWIGTLSGLSRWSGGKFETFNQFNSGMPNDLV